MSRHIATALKKVFVAQVAAFTDVKSKLIMIWAEIDREAHDGSLALGNCRSDLFAGDTATVA